MTARMLQVRMVTNLPSLPSISSYHPQSQTKKREFLSPDYRKKKLFAVSRGN